jgi:hypothetical protein
LGEAEIGEGGCGGVFGVGGRVFMSNDVVLRGLGLGIRFGENGSGE